MNRDDIIRIAREAGLNTQTLRSEVTIVGVPAAPNGLAMLTIEHLERFAELVAAAEREACAKLCDDRASSGEHFIEGYAEAKGCADAIRARREK